ncbi:dUTP diphosphatase [Spiroplasma taiwanense]|uniref:dUTP diphosphatase n=1 Tax=Spiroplasma taiwanense CT-1 TaxID=1276220 RepID=S5LY07_9MOLU|nr:dUTP diphosphatase [Spiroplasma taiwanense]AGR41486.1 dUTP diphosphatase [Spiroplasma taiwanense CT-1]
MLKNKNLIYLKDKQIILDKYIMENKGLVVNSEITKKKIIALLVEISEFVNEYRSFKYWSNKKPSERNILLEEYIDALHFILSLGNDLNFNFEKFKNQSTLNILNIDDWTIEVYLKILEFQKNQDFNSFSILFNVFLVLVDLLNVSDEELLEIYNNKNEINFKRQNTGY